MTRESHERADRPAAVEADGAFFRSAFEYAAIGMALVGLDGRWLKVNRALCDILGYAPADLLATTFQALTHPEDLDADLDLARRLIAGELRDYQWTKRYLHRAGHVVWALLSVSLVRDGAGRPLHFISQVQDVTDRKRAEWLEQDGRAVIERVARHEPLDDVLAATTALVERQVPGSAAGVMLLENGALRLVAPNLPPLLTDAIRARSLTLAHALHARCDAPGDAAAVPVAVSDIAADAEWDAAGLREASSAAGLAACWAAPVRCSEGLFLGMLLVFLRRPGARPDLADVRVLEMAGRTTTLAVEHRQATERLAHQAHHDALTGLPNRMLFDDRLRQVLAMARRTGRHVALLAIDLDRFKQVNDTYGHAAGDDLLQQFALRVRSGLRESDTLARIGGDEFVAILAQVERPHDAGVVAGRIVELLAQPFEVGGRVLHVTGSIGVACWPADGDDAVTLQRAADAAMYAVKSAGRNAFAWAGPATDEPELDGEDGAGTGAGTATTAA